MSQLYPNSFVFETHDALKYGVNAAIILAVMRQIVTHDFFYNGKYWIRTSKKSWAELFPFFSYKQVEKIIDKLVKTGTLIKGNFNENPRDKTLWYALAK